VNSSCVPSGGTPELAVETSPLPLIDRCLGAKTLAGGLSLIAWLQQLSLTGAVEVPSFGN
jgi:hypothetical protein